MEYVNLGREGKIILSDGIHKASFELLDIYSMNGTEYAVLLENGDDTVTILAYSDNGDNEKFHTVDDDTVFDRVYDVYMRDGG